MNAHITHRGLFIIHILVMHLFVGQANCAPRLPVDVQCVDVDPTLYVRRAESVLSVLKDSESRLSVLEGPCQTVYDSFGSVVLLSYQYYPSNDLSAHRFRYEPIEIDLVFMTDGEIAEKAPLDFQRMTGELISARGTQFVIVDKASLELTLTLLKGLPQGINRFETNALVTQFVEMAQADPVVRIKTGINGLILEVQSAFKNPSGRSRDVVGYEISTGQFTTLQFTSPNLISRLNEYAFQLKAIDRVQEFLTKAAPILSAEIPPWNSRVVLHAKTARLEYVYRYNSVYTYALPNNIQWDAFPEISQAHRIIQQKLASGPEEFRNCEVGHGQDRYTGCQWLERGEYPLSVPLVCPELPRQQLVQMPDGRMWVPPHSPIAKIKMFPDGSFRDLSFLYVY
jgi:hypothetical protein